MRILQGWMELRGERGEGERSSLRNYVGDLPPRAGQSFEVAIGTGAWAWAFRLPLFLTWTGAGRYEPGASADALAVLKKRGL